MYRKLLVLSAILLWAGLKPALACEPPSRTNWFMTVGPSFTSLRVPGAVLNTEGMSNSGIQENFSSQIKSGLALSINPQIRIAGGLFYSPELRTSMWRSASAYTATSPKATVRNEMQVFAFGADAIPVALKLNLLRYNGVSPYLEAGLGGTYNIASRFSEQMYVNDNKVSQSRKALIPKATAFVQAGAGINFKMCCGTKAGIGLLYQHQLGSYNNDWGVMANPDWGVGAMSFSRGTMLMRLSVEL